MKKLLIGIAIVIAVIVAVAFAAPFFIPTDSYKAELIAKVKQATGRDLRIDGPLSFSLLPQIALSAQNVSFSNAPGGSAKTMAQLKALDVRLKLLPLLTGTVAIDSFVLTDPVIALEVDKSGRPNWQFEPETGAKPAAAQAPAPAAGKNGSGMSALASLRIGGLKLVNGDVTYVDARSGARREASAINMTLSMADLESTMTADGSATWNGEKVSLTYTVERPGAFEGGAPSKIALKIASNPINLDFSGSGVGSPELKVTGDVSLTTPSVRNLAKWAGTPVAASGGGLGPLSIKGKLSVAGDKYAFQDAAVSLDSIKGNGVVEIDTGGARPYVKGSLNVDTLDLNPYLSATTGTSTSSAPAGGGAAGGAAAASEQGWSNEPIDVAPLKLVDMDFDLGAQAIHYRKIQIGKSALQLQIKDGKLVANLNDLELYQGKGKGAITVDGSGATPAITENLSVQGIDLLPFLRDAGNFTTLSGTGSLEMTGITGHGKSQREIIASLGGKGSIHVDKGSIKGVNLLGMVQSASSALTGGLLGSGQETQFTTLNATYVITNGILKNDDLQVAIPSMPMSGAGTVDLPQRHVDYRLTPKLAGLSVPIAITGPWDNLSYHPDLTALAKDPAKLLQGVAKAPGGATNALQGLFGGKKK
jgi:AsmA protein